MPDLRLRPVPDCLCPALRPTFNPYSDKVEVSLVRKGLRGVRLSGTKIVARNHYKVEFNYRKLDT